MVAVPYSGWRNSTPHRSAVCGDGAHGLEFLVILAMPLEQALSHADVAVDVDVDVEITSKLWLL